MKALIFNSGFGKRMGEFTKTHHKCQAVLKNGETILERQIRILASCGIREFVITTGPFKEQIIATTKLPCFKGLAFTFVDNPDYDSTNYIYSMYLAKEYLDDDFLTLHGDLVFNRGSVLKILACESPSAGMVNAKKALPEKDFKARVVDGFVREVSINIFDDDCMAFQPLYKLDRASLKAWLDKVNEYIENGVNTCYAENAMNEIAYDLSIKALSYEDGFVDEVDNLEDLARVSAEITGFDYREQPVYEGMESLSSLKEILDLNCKKKPLIVCGRFTQSILSAKFEELGINGIVFGGYSPNPVLEEVCTGVLLYQKEGCDCVISIGGGSALDTGKNICLLADADEKELHAFKEGILPAHNNAIHIAVPTTAGTGAESTRFSVVYQDGKKRSVLHESMLPDAVFLIPETVETLPLYQKKCTAMDALCQCIESVWSVNATAHSRAYALAGIKALLSSLPAYLEGDENAAGPMLRAANLSGKAINISMTTAAHAMSYKLTSMYGLPHGAAAAVSLLEVWNYMADFENEKEELREAFRLINEAFGCESTAASIDSYRKLLTDLALIPTKLQAGEEEIKELAASVNTERLKNNPVALDAEVLADMYRRIAAKV